VKGSLLCGGAGVVAALLVLSSPAGAVPQKPTGKPRASVAVVGSVVAGKAVRLRLGARAVSGRRIVRYRLAFGDRTPSRVARRRPPRRASHVFARPGRYSVRLAVTDSAGRSATARLRLTVRAATLAPNLGAGLPPWSGSPPLVFHQQPPPPPGPPAPPPVDPPPPPLPPVDVEFGAYELVLQPGSTGAVDQGVLSGVTELDPLPADAPSDVSARLDGEQLTIATTADAVPRSTSLQLTGVGCLESADPALRECDQKFRMTVPLTVVPLEAAGWVAAFTSPSPDRVAAADPLPVAGATLRDELLVTLGTPDLPGSREEADAAAQAVGGVVAGGIPTLGIFEVRWTEPQDLALRRDQLLAQPGVRAVDESNIGLIGTDAEPPGDWADDTLEATWPFEQINAHEAWDVTQGAGVSVGIVDGDPVQRDHEDLDVVATFGAGAPDHHATHVAGLACARANGKGVVGVAWGCPLWSSGIPHPPADKHVLVAAESVASGVGAGVVNISLGYNHEGPLSDRCATASEQQALVQSAQGFKQRFREFFQGPLGSQVVWTLSAGNNCAAGVPSPWGQNSDLPNVVTVAATNSDGTLASFSDFGQNVELAAPGGVGLHPVGDGNMGLWSTWTRLPCGLFGAFRCDGYGRDYGTSMAAPVVAGVVALVRSAHPGFSAAAAARCVTDTTGSGVRTVTTSSSHPEHGYVRHVAYQPATLAIVDAKAAVDCDLVDGSDRDAYLGRWAGGGWSVDIVEEPDGSLALFHLGETFYANGCVDPPGVKLAQGFLFGGDQWLGEALAASADCVQRAYFPSAAMRLVLGPDGDPQLVIAWPTHVPAPRPTIELDGSVTPGSIVGRMKRSGPALTGQQARRLSMEANQLPTVSPESAEAGEFSAAVRGR